VLSTKWKHVKAVGIRLIADPRTLALSASAGMVHLQFRNKSRVPCYLIVDDLRVSDNNVAASSISAGSSRIHVSRGKPGALLMKAHEGTEKVGEWKPLGVGTATLFSAIRVIDKFNIAFGSEQPEDDLTVVP